MFRRPSGSRGGQTSPEQVYRDLRSMALQATQRTTIQCREDHPDVFGAVVDIPAQGGYATVVALGDDTTSLYTSTGGGTIGAGGRRDVADAARRLLAVVQAHLASITNSDDEGLPRDGLVRLHVLTGEGLRFTDIPEDAFWGKAPHPLMPVIEGVQLVISLLRNVNPS